MTYIAYRYTFINDDYINIYFDPYCDPEYYETSPPYGAVTEYGAVTDDLNVFSSIIEEYLNKNNLIPRLRIFRLFLNELYTFKCSNV